MADASWSIPVALGTLRRASALPLPTPRLDYSAHARELLASIEAQPLGSVPMLEPPAPSAEEIATKLAEKLGPATRVVFLTETNAELATGQSFDWWATVAQRLGVPIANPTGRKRVIDVEALRAALAASVPAPETSQSEDPIAQIHRVLAERLNGGRHAC